MNTENKLEYACGLLTLIIAIAAAHFRSGQFVAVPVSLVVFGILFMVRAVRTDSQEKIAALEERIKKLEGKT